MEMKELLIILVVALVVFGAKRLRSVGEDLGHAVRGFKKAMSQGELEDTAGSPPHRQLGAAAPPVELPAVAKATMADAAAGGDRVT